MQNIEYVRWYSELRRKLKQGMGAVGSIRNTMVSVASLRGSLLLVYLSFHLCNVSKSYY